MTAAGIRCVLDDRNEKIGYKIREAQQVERVPYMLVLGAREAADHTVTVRNRDTGESETMSLEAFVEKTVRENKERIS